jgi:uncharacterized GH25 family protein
MRILALILSLLSAPALAHEFWIEPLAYQVSADVKLEANIVNGQEFAGTKLAYLPQRFANFIVFAGQETVRVGGRAGDMPALNQDAVTEGLNVAAYQANNATVDYATWDKFQKFVDHKNFGDVLSRHTARGLPEDDFLEVYSRYSKTLIGVGHGEGSDRRIGLETEIVALTNPYTDDLSGGFQVQVYYRDDLRADTQVEVFKKASDGTVTIDLYRTDDQGIATFPVAPGHAYMVDAVVLLEPSAALMETTGAVWQTLWANLTFAVPE